MKVSDDDPRNTPFSWPLPGDAQCSYANGHTPACYEGVRTRKDRQETKGRITARRQSPLEMLIESIEDVLATFDGSELFGRVGPNPFNTDPDYQRPIRGLPTYGFQAEPAYHHDIALLKSQLGSLHEILSSLDD